MNILGGKYENLKLGTKLSLGFGSVLLLSLVVLISGVIGFRSVADNNDKALASNQLNATLAQARLLRTQFQLTHDYRLIDKNGELINKMDDILRQAKTLHWDKEAINDVNQIEEDLKSYRVTREAFIAASKKRDAAGLAIGQDESGSVLEAFHNKWQQVAGVSSDIQVLLYQLGENMADIRDVAHDLLLGPSDNTLGVTLKNIDATEAAIREKAGRLSAEQQAWLNTAWDYFAGYRRSAPAYLAAFKDETRASQAMTEAAEKLNTDVGSLFNQQLANSNQTTQSSEFNMVATGLSVILLGIIMAWRISVQLIVPLKLSLSVAERIASGDLSSVVSTTRRDELGQLLTAMGNMNDKLRTMIRDIREGVSHVESASAEIAAGNTDLSSRTEQQSAAVVETAASMEQLTSTVKQNSENAHHASQLASEASQNAVKGGEIVNNVVKTMDDISSSSKRISDITTVINSIAFQTNILALNAAVEAARAGEQGRGFAVVASEVRNLAQRSAQAAREIEGLIHESVSRVDTGSALVGEAGKTMQDIVSSVAHVFDIMGEIASASDEQSRGISQIAQAVSELDTTTQQNAALVEESSSAANSLEEQSRILAQAVSAFHLGDDAHASGGTSVSPALLLGKPGHHGKKPTFRKGVGDKPTDSARHPPAEGEWMRF